MYVIKSAIILILVQSVGKRVHKPRTFDLKTSKTKTMAHSLSTYIIYYRAMLIAVPRYPVM